MKVYYKILSFLFLCSFSVKGSEGNRGSQHTAEVPYRSGHYANVFATDIFGAAELLKGILENQKELEQMFDSPTKILKATLIVGGIAAVVKLGLTGTQKVIEQLPQICIRLFNKSKFWGMSILGLPQPLSLEQVLIWEHLFENIMCTLCEQDNTAYIMLRTVGADEQIYEGGHWHYYQGLIHAMLLQIDHFLQDHKAFYLSAQSYIVSHEHKMVCFIIETIVSSLEHIRSVCQEATSFDDVPKDYLKKVTRNTLMLFQKLRCLIGGAVPNGHVTSSPLFASSKKDPISNAGMISY